MIPASFFILALLVAYKVWAPVKSEVVGSGRLKVYLYIACVVAIAIWCVRLFPLLTSTSYTPDEAWFVHDIVVRNENQEPNSYFWWFERYFAQANLFGYGSIWWGLYSIIIDVSTLVFHPAQKLSSESQVIGDFISNFLNEVNSGNKYLELSTWIMRSLSLSVATIFLLRVSRRIFKESFAVLGVLLLLTMPMMYWSGKLASPEYFGAFLLLISVFGYFDGRNQNWFLLAGIACGVKLTCAPVAAIFFLSALPYEWRSGGMKKCIIGGMRFAVGLLLANFYLVTHPVEFFSNLLMYSSLFPAAPWQMSFMSGPLPFWDGGTYGNLSYWFGSLITFLVVLFVSFFANARLAIWFALAAAAMFVFMLTQPLHNWYWFPVILGSIVPVAFSTCRGVTYRAVFAASFAAVIGVNFYFSLPNIKSELSFRQSHIAEYKSFDRDVSCVQSEISAAKPKVVYDMAMIGRSVNVLDETLRKNYPASFSALPGMQELQGKSGQLAIIGPRAAAITPISNFIDKAVAAGAEHGLCGKTLWVKF
ncbi:hypothetical protein PS712_04138 [Pseudomonas fluorescens]|uniref:Uncharacterized protein n=1 Tax=Pseudomonas fluorescens TaxID=294 RepID=A0A5E7DQQ4_PSEFL|nr:glycosyltransferase family 39 protein [Pseudomonas fluorescens]VVO19797.1 hypothetical protein PS712_04138 [Pseudomonas fluorescens]